LKPPKPKWYQATPATSSTAKGSGPTAGGRGNRRRRRRYADIVVGVDEDE
jgi:hypothetical protein